ncbi:hypothetical protein AB4402_11005 [Vibrio breoganii]
MGKLAIIGGTSNLSDAIINELNNSFVTITIYSRSVLNEGSSVKFDAKDLSCNNIKTCFKENHDVYIFNLGLLYSKRILEQTQEEIFESLSVNALFIIKSCEYILSNNSSARIFIIGSESGKKGSFDTTYFLSKSMLRSFVKERYLNYPMQQLILISPSTIEDASMTINRSDLERLKGYKELHPKKRFLNCSEIAMLISKLIDSTIYLTNCEVELNGGKFARMKY